MATIGLDRLFYATIMEMQNGYESYGTPIQLAKAISASLSIEVAEASLYADDALSEFAREFKSGKLSLGVDDIGIEAAQILTGATVDNNGVLVSSTEDTPQPVAIGFRAKKANGRYRYFWLFRVVFSVPSTELSTKGDSISFATPKIEGTIMRRNRPDFTGKHPWKVEVDEPNENLQAAQNLLMNRAATNNLTSVIANWYNEVYEPSYTLAISPTRLRVDVGGTATLSVDASGDTDMLWSYTWYENTTPTNTGGVAIVGATGPQYTTAVFESAWTYYYYCVINTGDATITTDVATIQVA